MRTERNDEVSCRSCLAYPLRGASAAPLPICRELLKKLNRVLLTNGGEHGGKFVGDDPLRWPSRTCRERGYFAKIVSPSRVRQNDHVKKIDIFLRAEHCLPADCRGGSRNSATKGPSAPLAQADPPEIVENFYYRRLSLLIGVSIPLI